ncbi:CBS domain-containing protein [Candidatus Bathyarchaeota archaeon]|nr:CBS domain-containing protein [Candidatus Bathyarchaeota archaeon]
MLPKLEEIEKRRKSLGLRQKELARMVGISQSMIAKIESGRINPSYTKTKAIFDMLESLEKKRETKVKEIIQGKVVGIQRGETVSKATKIMHESGYSQLPVFDGVRPIGSISERTVLNQILSGKDPKILSKTPVENVMDEAFPTVDEETPITLISTLLQYSQAVLVTKRGEIRGIVTKADLLKVVPTY